MIDPISIAAIGAAALFLVAAYYFYSQADREKRMAAELATEKAELDKKVRGLEKELSGSKKKGSPAAPAKAASPAVDKDQSKEVEALREEVKEQKKKLHEVKEQLKEANAKEANRGDTRSNQALLEMRGELATALTDVENFKTRAKKAEAEVAELTRPVEAAPEVATPEVVTPEDFERLKNLHKKELHELRLEHRKEILEMEESSKQAVRASKDKLLPEVKDLREKVKRQAREIDHQKRRATNNDKAYKITQLQLDASLEKLALIDPSVQAPGGYYNPEVEAKLREKEDADRQKAAEKQQQAAAAAALANLAGAAPDEPAPKAEPKVEAAPKAEPVAEAAAAPKAEAVAESVAEPAPKVVAPLFTAPVAAEPASVAAEVAPSEGEIDFGAMADGDEGMLDLFGGAGGLEDGWSLEPTNVSSMLGPKKAQKETP